MKTTVTCITRLVESFNKGVLTVKVIQPGFNKSKTRYYPADTLKRDYKVFEGAKMFVNHQTDEEQQARPEGSINDWVATLRKVWVEKDGTIMGEAVVVDPAFQSKLAALASKNMLSQMGVSIRAIGEASEKEIDGVETSYVEALLSARSVDFVTFAGAGGEVLAMESNRLPKPLKELNEVVESLAWPYRPHSTEADKRLVESWKQRGLTPKAAEVAAKVQTKMAPPASDIEFWSKFKW